MDTPAGIEITGPMHDRFEEILAPRALELVGVLHRALAGRREGLPHPVRLRADAVRTS